jgi:RNA polymerase sigma-70 factor (ECF subfamily)
MATQNDMALAEDQDLVRDALREPKAYALIVRRYEAPLKRYVGRLLGASSQSIEDVLQEVFIKAYVNLNDYDQRRRFSPWIFRIAHNEAKSLLRKQRTEPRVISGEEGLLILERMTERTDAQSNLDVAADEERLRAALAGLDKRYREVMVLRFLEEKNYEDISDILALPMGTVATLISRGKQQLRRALGDRDLAGEGHG